MIEVGGDGIKSPTPMSFQILERDIMIRSLGCLYSILSIQKVLKTNMHSCRGYYCVLI